MNYTIYQCPVCRTEMKRDITIFLHHTDGHIRDVMRRNHPDWFSGDGEHQIAGHIFNQMGTN